jgi:ribonuclease E
MGAIHRLLERLGFVKLDRYGLLLTPDGRIISTRPAVLDDGLGGRIVGWQDGDLAAMELQKWEPARPAPKASTASRVAVALAPTVPVRPPVPIAAKMVAPAVQVPATVAAPVQAAATGPKLPGIAPVVAPVVAPTIPAPVAAAEEPGEDEWEWTVAMAKARAAAEETEAAAAAPKFVAPAAKPVVAAPKPVAAPTPVAAAAKKPAFVPVKTEPMVKVAAPAIPAPLPEPEEDWDALIAKASAPPKTIIPVPQLPRVTNTAMVRPAVVPVVAPLRRVPRSTNRIEDTVRTHAAPANDDKTSPGIALPPSGGGRRVAAKQK